MYSPFKPPPAPAGFGQGKTVPETSASILSRIFFEWLTPFLSVGFSRPLQQDDFWDLPETRRTAHITDVLQTEYFKRCPPEKRPRFLDSHYDNTPSGETVKEKEGSDTRKKKKYDESLVKALYRSFTYQIWFGGFMKLTSDTLKTTTPLVTKVFLNWLVSSYVYHRLNDAEKEAVATQGIKQPQGIGYGIGIAFALFAMQEVASLMTNHYMLVAATTGIYVRTALIGNIFRKSLRLTGRARMDHSTGQITTMISTDASRLDRFTTLGHTIWVGPIQLAIGIGLLLGNLGYSALVGLGVLILGFPLQMVFVRIMLKQRIKGVKITDQRVRLATEVLQGIRLIKCYAWEDFYVHQTSLLRGREIQTVKKLSIARAFLISLVTLTPVLASVLSFITYSLSGHDLNIAIIFTSLQLFNVIRAPLLFFPLVFAGLTDALVALRRIGTFLRAEELSEPYLIQEEAKEGLVVDGDFTWEVVKGTSGASKFDTTAKKAGGKEAKGSSSGKGSPAGKEQVLPTARKQGGSDAIDEKQEGQEQKEDEKPFELRDLKLHVHKGAFVAIVGKVGAGKSSILQAIIGEMRKSRGSVIFGGTVSYVPQTAWIKNATLRQNVTFGLPDDETRFQQVVEACCLEHDIAMLPQNENTEIGEKGINLSGGQKARVSIARAAYSEADIVLLDDSLSAVDAYVGRKILDNCILAGPLSTRTRILVTHALHVLDKADYIYVVDAGTIVEEGTYMALASKGDSVLYKLLEEYGSLEEATEDSDSPDLVYDEKKKEDTDSAVELEQNTVALMQKEERSVGAVTWSTYRGYLKFAGGVFWAPVILGLLVATQAAAVSNNLFLGFWTGSSTGTGIHGFSQGDYMAVYAALGVAQALLSFVLTICFSLMCLRASLGLFRAAMTGVLNSPVSMFDTTPIGRILSRFSKDQDTLDTDLLNISYQFMTTFSYVIGTVFLVFYTFPLLGILFGPLTVLYYVVFSFYRRSSVESKRLDSVLRSKLYASFSETFTGLSTIRAYGIQEDAVKSAEEGLDWQNKAYYMTTAIQRWLAVRLDMFGNVLILGISLFAAGLRYSVSPSKVGVVLTYALSITQIFSDMVSQFAQNEQNMNAVERVLEYTELPPEGEKRSKDDPPESWPQYGQITFKDVDLSYRPGLPLVLKNVSFEVRQGEKVGIIGRTGAGKSSLLQALFRTVKLSSGSVLIDDVDIGNVGLSTLRSRLALVPQDSTLFLGTLRENLDPLNQSTDAELMSVLQRVWLTPASGPTDLAVEAKFGLDAAVSDEGANYSAGEKQLLALARALIKNSRVIVLDEATSSIDVETDAKLQQTIRKEFADVTLLCIAHRLNTIAYYDRVLVMDAGKVAEFDTVLSLFDKSDSIFRSLCDEANLSRADILKIRAQNDTADLKL